MSPKFLHAPPPAHDAGLQSMLPAGAAWQIPWPALAEVLTFGAPVGLLLVNVGAYLCFGADKRRAMLGEWRISEAALLLLALVGGSIGAKLGQRRFRHKTRKEPFRSLLNLILLGQAGAAGLLLVYLA